MLTIAGCATWRSLSSIVSAQLHGRELRYEYFSSWPNRIHMPLFGFRNVGEDRQIPTLGDFLTHQGVQSPDRMTRMLAPGLDVLPPLLRMAWASCSVVWSEQDDIRCTTAATTGFRHRGTRMGAMLRSVHKHCNSRYTV